MLDNPPSSDKKETRRSRNTKVHLRCVLPYPLPHPEFPIPIFPSLPPTRSPPPSSPTAPICRAASCPPRSCEKRVCWTLGKATSGGVVLGFGEEHAAVSSPCPDPHTAGLPAGLPSVCPCTSCGLTTPVRCLMLGAWWAAPTPAASFPRPSNWTFTARSSKVGGGVDSEIDAWIPFLGSLSHLFNLPSSSHSRLPATRSDEVQEPFAGGQGRHCG